MVYIKEENSSSLSKSRMVPEEEIKNAVKTDDVIVKLANYSYNELNNVMNRLNDFKLENPDNSIANNFNLYWLSDKDNSVIVELDNFNNEQINIFKETVLNSPIIEFRQAKSGIPTYDINPGQKFDISNSNNFASMGYRARRNGVNGIVTAGHIGGYGTILSVNGTTFAKITDRSIAGSVDAAFAELTNASISLTNTLDGTNNTLSTTISEPGVGTIINIIGATSSHSTGNVLSTNASITMPDGTKYTNLTSADYASGSGDSGCIVYSYVSSSGTRYTLGTHSISYGTTKYYTKANQTNAYLGTTRY